MIIIDRETMTHEEWLAWRRKGLGSSVAPAIMGFSKWQTPFEVFLEGTGRIVGRRRERWEWKVMERGRVLEKLARRAYEARTGIRMPPACVVHSEKLAWLRASLDGLQLNVRGMTEFKGPGEEDHAKALAGEITDYGRWQCVHDLIVTDLDWIDFASYRDKDYPNIDLNSFRPELLADPIRIYRDEKTERVLFDAEREMWERIQNDDPPYSPNCRPSVRVKAYRRKANGREVLLSR